MSAPGSRPPHGTPRCVDLVRAHDWAAGPLGPVATWPGELRHLVRVVLDAAVPAALWWGAERVQVYNDAHAVLLGDRHPAAFGRPAGTGWGEAWTQLGPLADEVGAAGHGLHRRDLRVLVQRTGRPEARWLALGLSPVRVPGGGVGGLLFVAADTTDRVLSERRLALLADLATVPLLAGDTPDEVLTRAGVVLADHGAVVPAVAVYLRSADAATLRRALATGAAAARARGGPFPATVAGGGRSPLARVAATGRPEVLRGLRERRSGPPATGAAEEPSDQALVLPLHPAADDAVVGALVLGLDAHRPLDAGQRVLGEQLARTLSTLLSGVGVLAAERARREAAEARAARAADRLRETGERLRGPLALVLTPLQQLVAVDRPATDAHRELLAAAHRAARRLAGVVDELSPTVPATPTAATGSTTLPAESREPVEPGPGPDEAVDPGPDLAAWAAGRALLVVADDDLRDVLTRLLGAHGWEVATAPDILAALRTADVPDVVLADTGDGADSAGNAGGAGNADSADGADGRDRRTLIRTLRSVPATARVPVLLVGRRTDPAAVVAALRAGADDHVGTPFAPEELLARVHAHVARHRGEQAAARAAAQEAASLRVALGTNRRIGNAMGMVMAREQVPAEEAFERLRRHSQRTNRKLADLAAEIVTTGVVPDLPPPRTDPPPSRPG